MSPMEIMKNAEIERLKQLITELADALDWWPGEANLELIRRAREVTNGR